MTEATPISYLTNTSRPCNFPALSRCIASSALSQGYSSRRHGGTEFTLSLRSPSFHLSSRRKVSLRTKTLLKSSAALAERLTAQAEAEMESPTTSATGSPMGSPTLGPRMSPLLSEISSLRLQGEEEQEATEGELMPVIGLTPTFSGPRLKG